MLTTGLAVLFGLSWALFTSAAPIVAPARTSTAAAMPATFIGPPGTRGRCTNVRFRSAVRSGGALARTVIVRRTSCPVHGARALTVTVAGAEEFGALCT